MVKGDKKYYLEINRNLDRQKKVFSEKKTWYDQESGQPHSYSETDFRTGVSITNRMTDSGILTEVKEGDEQLEISLDNEKGLVPFEVLTLYLRKSLQKLQKDKELTFTLYLPIMAIELKRKNMPTSFSRFEMTTSIVDRKTEKTPLGMKSAVQILLKPTSFLINSILPKEKTSFYFTFMVEPPHLLLSFQENKTKSTLTIYDP